MGPGAVFTTKEMTGAEVTQFSAVKDLGSIDTDVIADGGIRKPGDMVKDLMLELTA